MPHLALRAYLELIYFEVFLIRRDFSRLYQKVSGFPLGRAPNLPDCVDKLCAALDMACIWYPKQVLCLQRSAAAVCLLRSSGVRARLVIGAQPLPFRTHAWVEVNGRVVTDKPYMREIYAVLDEC
jgi:hypothetical protein